jgi:hypothetical protein
MWRLHDYGLQKLKPIQLTPPRRQPFRLFCFPCQALVAPLGVSHTLAGVHGPAWLAEISTSSFESLQGWTQTSMHLSVSTVVSASIIMAKDRPSHKGPYSSTDITQCYNSMEVTQTLPPHTYTQWKLPDSASEHSRDYPSANSSHTFHS